MHVLYFSASLLAVVAFAPALLAPGYLLAFAMDLCGFRGMRWPEQVLWSIALSGPPALLLAVYGGLLVGNGGVAALFLGLFAVACAVCWRTRRGGLPEGWFRSGPVRWVCGVVGGVAAYLLVAGAPVELRGRLLEGVASGDWSVRVPLLASAMRTGMPLLNPFYAVGGMVGPLRYYMYWYALGGAVGGPWHLPARAVMEAGCVWAAVLLFATMFVLVKTVFRPAPEWPSIRWGAVCLGCLCAMPMLGLDVLQAMYALFVVPMLSPEIEWWRAYAGFTPSFHTFLLYAPHHAFGVSAGMMGLLLLGLPQMRGLPEFERGPGRTVALGAIAGICFGAAAGTSTYVALFFALTCGLMLVDAAVRKDGWRVAAVVVSGVVALAGAGYFAHLMLGNPVKGADGGFVHFSLRGWTSTVEWYRSQWSQRGLAAPRGRVLWPSVFVLWLLLELSEMGVFALLLVYRVRRDLPGRARLLPEQRMQWMLVGSLLGCALLLTSAGELPSNDLGYHAAFCLRVVAVLWTAPWLVSLWERPTERRVFLQSWVGRTALVLAVLGLVTQAWQVVGQRTALLVPGQLHRFDGPFPSPPHLAQQYEAVYQAWQAADRLLPRDARVLTNPDSVQRTMGMLYANRQMVAPEPKCMAAFGGNPVQCRLAVPDIEQAFGAGADEASFAAACRTQAATAVLVSADDGAWQAGSWVWRQTPVYAGLRERLYRCPAER